MSTLGGPLFDPLNNVKSFVYQIDTKIIFSQQIEVMEALFNDVDRYFTAQLASAPVGLQDGWFYSYFEFYDLQKELAHGIYVAMALSVTVCAVVLLLTTLDLLISFYALVTIVFCISVTVAALILLGWELNVVESSILTMAVGLSVDFTIHYGVAYLHAKPGTPRTERVRGAFERVASALTMAAFTTFLAGTNFKKFLTF